MNQITLEDTLEALQKEQFEVVIDEEIRQRAYRSVERMLGIG
jgi:quinolinate synthase